MLTVKKVLIATNPSYVYWLPALWHFLTDFKFTLWQW